MFSLLMPIYEEHFYFTNDICRFSGESLDATIRCFEHVHNSLFPAPAYLLKLSQWKLADLHYLYDQIVLKWKRVFKSSHSTTGMCSSQNHLPDHLIDFSLGRHYSENYHYCKPWLCMGYPIIYIYSWIGQHVHCWNKYTLVQRFKEPNFDYCTITAFLQHCIVRWLTSWIWCAKLHSYRIVES